MKLKTTEQLTNQWAEGAIDLTDLFIQDRTEIKEVLSGLITQMFREADDREDRVEITDVIYIINETL